MAPDTYADMGRVETTDVIKLDILRWYVLKIKPACSTCTDEVCNKRLRVKKIKRTKGPVLARS